MPNLKKKSQLPKKSLKRSKEDVLQEKRERERARRQKIKNNPEEYEKQRQREKQRYLKRKTEGKIKLINDLSVRDKRQKRKIWIQHNKTYRDKKKKLTTIENEVLCNTPPPSINDLNEVQVAENIVGQNERNLQRKIIRLKVRAHREALRQKKVIEALKRENRRLRSKKVTEKISAQYRSPNDTTTTEECPLPDLTPNTKIDNILENAGVVVPDTIRKELVFGECVKQQLNQNFKSFKGHRSKQMFAEVVGAKALKKYGVTRKLAMSKYLSRSLSHDKRKQTMSKTETIKKNVIAFYERDENSRLCAGKKECITYKKVKKQKRYMNYSLKSLYKKFKIEKEIKISYTSFCRLRPFWVVPPRLGSRDTCLCITHENFRLVAAKLYSEKIINLINPEAIISAITCNPNREECLSRSCQNCKEIQIPINEFNGSNQCQYQKWSSKKETRVSSKTGKPIVVQITLKEDITISYYDLFNELLHQITKYMAHVRNVYHQHQALSTVKKSLTDSELLLHVDFSENYACKYSSEAQSVHFGASRQQITLHTGVAYKKNNLQSFCTVSSSLRHDAKAIAAHLIPVIRHFATDTIDTLHFLSDSPSTQYRNKTMFSIIAKYLPNVFPKIIKISWSYSEAGHGKGAPDGVGATFKRTADRLVAENHDIPNYEKFLKIIKENVTNIYIETLDESYITKVASEIDDSLDTFKGTMQVHNVTWCRNNNILHMNSLTCPICEIGKCCEHFKLGEITIHDSSSVICHDDADQVTEKAEVRVLPTNKIIKVTDKSDDAAEDVMSNTRSEIEPDDWVAVLFDDFWYPGVVLSIKRRSLEIQFMGRKGEQFFWPEKRDVQIIPPAGILLKLSKPPIPCSARLFYVPESKKINEMV